MFKDPFSLIVMHHGQATESWTTKQPFSCETLTEGKSVCIVLFIVGIRSCLVFSNFTVSLLVLLLLFLNIPLGLVAISFGYYLWSNAAAKTKRKIGESLVASLYCVEKQEGSRSTQQEHEW